MSRTNISDWMKSGRLAFLERAANAKDGIVRDGTPSTGVGYSLFEDGLVEQIEPETFFGGVYRINDKGRAYWKEHAAPIGDW